MKMSKRFCSLLLMFALLCGCILFTACEKREASLSEIAIGAIPYRAKAPVKTQLYDSLSVKGRLPASWLAGGYAVSNMAEVTFIPMPGDTLFVRILEFADDVSALAFYLNSGLVQEALPVVEGESREIAMRSGRKLFVFRYGLLRNHSRAELEHYVQSFPGYRSGLPQEFLSLPFAGRIPGETSIQIRNFLGVPSEIPMLVQGYRAEDLSWNAARSWKSESSDAWRGFVAELQKSGRDVRIESDTVRFDAGAGMRGTALRLPGGRIVCVWGFLDEISLQKRFAEASRSVYDSPE
jgi:hypothetical protein